MAIFFCLKYWREIAENQTVCQICGADKAKLSEQSLLAKLMRSLRHRKPETPIRAAHVLGKLKAVEAVTDLIEIASSSPDPYIRATAIEALGNIRGARVQQFVKSFWYTSLTVIGKKMPPTKQQNTLASIELIQ